MTPSSSSSVAETCTAQPLSHDGFDASDAVLGADHHQDVVGAEYLRGPRPGENFLVPDDRHDRRPGAGVGSGVAERAVDERAAWPYRHLARVDPGTSLVSSANRSAIRGAPRIWARASASSSVSRKTR
jgi:hypothetical protein